jgi:hypothetical protein
MFKCELILLPDGCPAWRSDIVHLDGKGDVKIKCFNAEFEREPDEDNDWQWREASYTGERIT